MGSARQLSAGDVAECLVLRNPSNGPGGRADRPQEREFRRSLIACASILARANRRVIAIRWLIKGAREVALCQPD